MAAQNSYDADNVFARILRHEIPCRTVYDDAFALAFHDIAPKALVHVVVICKRPARSLADFTAQASTEEIAGFFRAVGHVARALALDAPGYRIVSNHGPDSGQEVAHFHVHLFGGGPLGDVIAASPQAD